MAGLEILNLPLTANDADAETVREYLQALLHRLLQDGEGFSGKRPFGNSGWEGDLYEPLIKAGLVKGSIDEYGHVDECDDKAAEGLIHEAIKAL